MGWRRLSHELDGPDAADGESRTSLASYEKKDARNNNHGVFRYDDCPRSPNESAHQDWNVHARFI